MTDLQLYKFITEHGCEYHWHGKEVLLFVDNSLIEEFKRILPSSIYDADGINWIAKKDYFVFEMQDICDYCDIYMGDVFENKENG